MPGKKIKQLRLKLGLSQNDLALKINSTQSVISRLEKNEEYADLNIIKRIGEALNVDYTSFFQDDMVIHRKDQEFTPPIHKLENELLRKIIEQKESEISFLRENNHKLLKIIESKGH